jgi:hypothetical protein
MCSSVSSTSSPEAPQYMQTSNDGYSFLSIRSIAMAARQFSCFPGASPQGFHKALLETLQKKLLYSKMQTGGARVRKTSLILLTFIATTRGYPRFHPQPYQ